jgi:allantoate deiminase
MGLRRDALAAAAECTLAVERIASHIADVVGTVGRIEAHPGAVNVIPGKVRFSLDARAPRDEARQEAVAAMRAEFDAIAARRGVAISLVPVWDARTAACTPLLQRQLASAILKEGFPVHHLPSGAGHDGMAVCAIAPVAMLFVRCAGGISHHPAEAVSLADVGTGARVLLRFIEHFQAPPR